MKRKRMDRENALLMLWSLSQFNDAIDNYRKVSRDYCLGRAKWEEVEAARKEANYCGIGNEKLLSIDLEVMESITDEELMEAVYGE